MRGVSSTHTLTTSAWKPARILATASSFVLNAAVSIVEARVRLLRSRRSPPSPGRPRRRRWSACRRARRGLRAAGLRREGSPSSPQATTSKARQAGTAARTSRHRVDDACAVFMAIPQSCRWPDRGRRDGRGTPRRSSTSRVPPEARVVPGVHRRHGQLAQPFHRLQVRADVAARHLVEQRPIAVHGVAREEDAASSPPRGRCCRASGPAGAGPRRRGRRGRSCRLRRACAVAVVGDDGERRGVEPLVGERRDAAARAARGRRRRSRPAGSPGTAAVTRHGGVSGVSRASRPRGGARGARGTRAGRPCDRSACA